MDGKGFPFRWISMGGKMGFAHGNFHSHLERKKMNLKEELGKILGEV